MQEEEVGDMAALEHVDTGDVMESLDIEVTDLVTDDEPAEAVVFTRTSTSHSTTC